MAAKSGGKNAKFGMSGGKMPGGKDVTGKKGTTVEGPGASLKALTGK